MSNRPNGLATLLGTPGRAVAILIAFILVAGVSLGSIAFMLFGPRGGSTPSSPRAAKPAAGQPCSAEPQVFVDGMAMTRDGLAVTLRLTGGCDSDDVLTGPGVGLSISGGSTDIAAGVFDLTGSPIALPGDRDATHTFVFPAGMYWRTPELVSARYSYGDLTATLTGASHGSGSGGYGSSVTARSPMSPAHGSADATAAAALGELSAADRSVVSSSLENWWVPQVSSKRVGLYTDGITYGNEDILRNHLQLRQQYDNVRLLWANDWSTFDIANWWVTIVGAPYSDSGQANGWCDSHGIGVNDCFAKVVSTTRGPAGTTVLRH